MRALTATLRYAGKRSSYKNARHLITIAYLRGPGDHAVLWRAADARGRTGLFITMRAAGQQAYTAAPCFRLKLIASVNASLFSPPGRLEDLDLSPHLQSGKVDVLVSEWMGYFLLFEGMLVSMS